MNKKRPKKKTAKKTLLFLYLFSILSPVIFPTVPYADPSKERALLVLVKIIRIPKISLIMIFIACIQVCNSA